MKEQKLFVKLSGVGIYIPERVLTNDDLSKIVDTSDEWIMARTGIKKRHIAAEDEATSDLCYQAALRALEDAKMSPEDIDAIVIGTVTPDMIFPSTAAIVQNKLGIKGCPCFDYESACAGSQYGTQLARTLLLSNVGYKNVLVICGDKLTSLTDWTDRTTCVLFGDAAGAMIFSATDDEQQNSVIDVLLGADGRLADLLRVPAGGSLEPATLDTVNDKKHFVKMAGRDVFREAVLTMTKSVEEILRRNGLSINDVDYFVPHQANLRIIEAVGERIGISSDKVCVTVDQYGNTAASSCIIALKTLIESGKLKEKSTILTVSFGAGLTWGTSLLRI